MSGWFFSENFIRYYCALVQMGEHLMGIVQILIKYCIYREKMHFSRVIEPVLSRTVYRIIIVPSIQLHGL